jgi:site-specific DNA-methyltransferase (adenine-specific)
MTKDIIKPIISEPNSINTETYIMNGPYDSEVQAVNAVSYIKTKFFHFLLGLKKITQHTTANTYQFIPLQDFSEPWTDEKLYKKYGLTEDEVAFIESMIRPMDLTTNESDDE